MQKKFTGANNEGFTLISSLLAIALIVIGLFSVMGLITIIVKGNIQSKRVTTATTIAQDKMEDLLRMDYEDISNNSGTYTDDTDYYWEMAVQEDTPSTYTKTVIIDVYWNPATSTSSNNVKLETIIAQ